MYIYRLKDGNLIINVFERETELIAADAANMDPHQLSWMCFDKVTCENQSSQSASEIHQAWGRSVNCYGSSVIFQQNKKKLVLNS